MSVTYNTTLKNTRMTDVVTALGTAAFINIYTAGLAVLLCSIALPNPAGTVSAGVLTFSGTPLSDPSADASGTAAAATCTTAVDGGGTLVISGLTVGSVVGATDIVLSSTNVVIAQPVTITTASITHG
jgi:hypothetical protein